MGCCPCCQPWLTGIGLLDMALLLAPAIEEFIIEFIGTPPMPGIMLGFMLPIPGFMLPIMAIMLGFMFMLFGICPGSLIL